MYSYRKKLHKYLFIIFSIIVLLIGFLVFINYTKIFAGFGYRTLKPKQEITVEVKPKVEQVDYNSTLRIVNKDGLKLKLTTGRDGELWHDLSTDTFFLTLLLKRRQLELSLIINL
ncbi:hypothetical protein [Enterococcus rivorum]|uniref:hypothetical protein n=1 Tax=Enterococcus rivorum TaxID=762845 RepID=UPI003640AE35